MTGIRLLICLVLLAAPIPLAAEPCSDCHEKGDIGAGSRSVHAPFSEDDCGSCHADHGDDGRLLLVEHGNALCEGCHDSEDRGFLRSHHDVRGPKASCVSCHDPHRSAEARLLRPNRHRPLVFGRCDPCHRYDGKLHKPVGQLCLGCHAGEEFSRKVGHAPVKRGDCLACHDPHASPLPSLLKARYTLDRWIGRESDVALCLGCHDRARLLAAASEGTNFRSGGSNLHALHVGGSGPPPAGEGRRPGAAAQNISCRGCHETHSSDGPRLVRRDLDCGGVPCLKLDYRRFDGGGQCLSGCHTPQDYAFAAAAASRSVAASAAAAPASAPAALPQPSALEQSINKRCVGCHEKQVKRFAAASIHAPVRAGACSFCHLDHGSENRLVLLGREDRVCARCHDLEAKTALAAHGGYSVAGSRCSECHDPHGGAASGFIYERRHPPFDEADCGACHGPPAAGWRIAGDVSRICGECHDGVGSEKHPHTAIAAKGCVGCHRAHAAKGRGLLRAPGAALCFTCHPAQRFAGESTHDPVGSGDCGTCHPAHGSANEGLLAGTYPLEQYVAFDKGRYGLCLDCHDEGALTDPDRADGTGFADGTKNLHALHVLDRVSISELGTRVQPGIACRNCHDPHAAASPRLIRRELDCNGVPCLKIEYRKVGAGGKCVGGCHVTQSYLPAADR